MRTYGFYLPVFTVLMLAVSVLAACGPLPAAPASASDEMAYGPQAIGSMVAGGPGAAAQPGVLRNAGASDAVTSLNASQAQDPSNPRVGFGQRIALFAIEPIGAPCCPLPTPDKALAAAQDALGVVAAELVDDKTVRAQFDLDQTDSMAIASAINQMSFLVTVKEEMDVSAQSSAVTQRGDTQ